jgi:hypothetical protein
VALLNDCLLLAPSSACLISNRALALHGLQLDSQALSELQKAVKVDHLNYLAYFNLFSLYFLS